MPDSPNRRLRPQIRQCAQRIIGICRRAAARGLMAGWSGNASVRCGDGMLITAAGSPKGMLSADDCLFIGADSTPRPECGKKPSSETAMHLAIYAAQPACKAILHTHPAMLQALTLLLCADSGDPVGALREHCLGIPLYEAEMWRKHLGFVRAFPPGSDALGAECASCASEIALPAAVWLMQHGLCAIAGSLEAALCLTEELEHLAQVQLLTLKGGNCPGSAAPGQS